MRLQYDAKIVCEVDLKSSHTVRQSGAIQYHRQIRVEVEFARQMDRIVTRRYADVLWLELMRNLVLAICGIELEVPPCVKTNDAIDQNSIEPRPGQQREQVIHL